MKCASVPRHNNPHRDSMMKNGFVSYPLISSTLGGIWITWKRWTILVIACCLSLGIASAQIKGPDGMVGVPYSFDILPMLIQTVARSINFPVSDISGPFVLALVPSPPPCCIAPPGLTLTSSFITGTPTLAGNWVFNIATTLTITDPTTGKSATYTVSPQPQVNIVITGNSGALFTINPSALSFSFIEGSTSPITQSVEITSNAELNYQFATGFKTDDSGNWLKALPAVPAPDCQGPDGQPCINAGIVGRLNRLGFRDR